MTLPIRILIGLISGFLLGLAARGSSSTFATVLLNSAEPIGTIFINLIRMTVIPLLASMVVATVGAMTWNGKLAATGLRAGLIGLVLLAVAALGSGVVAAQVFARVTVDQGVVQALTGSDAATPPSARPPSTTAAQWLVDMVPQNIVKAAADGAVLPVILFAAMFGAAMTRLNEERREPLLHIVRAAGDVMQKIVAWILQLSPIGVFALAISLAARLGWSAAGAVVVYLALVVVLTVVASIVLLYPVGVLAGRMSTASFVSYCAAPQALAFASRSSLATLPAMLQSADRAGLGGDARVILPLALSIFHFGAAVAQTVGVVFLARLFDVAVTVPQLLLLVLVVVVASVTVPGVPGGSIIAMTPVLLAAQVPLEGIGILLAVDTIPDMFRTTANVTGAMTLAALGSRQ